MTRTKSREAPATNDPYSVLGVPKDATKEQIKKAHRKLAKRHHPDAGADPSAFLPIQRAYETLIDDRARAFFDKTGIAPGSGEARDLEAAYQGIIRLFLQFLAQKSVAELKRTDVVDVLRTGVKDGIRKCEAELAQVAESEKNLHESREVLKAQLKQTDDTYPDLFQQAVDRAVEEMAAHRRGLAGTISVQRRMPQILQDFRFDPEKGEGLWTAAGTWRSTTSFTTSTFSWG